MTMTAGVEGCTHCAAQDDDEREPSLVKIRTWPAAVGVPRAAAALGISTSWAYQLVAQGEFPVRVIKMGKRTRVVTAELIRLLEAGGE